MKRNKSYYSALGADIYNKQGRIVIFAYPKSWQQKAKVNGYHQARDAWKRNNPGCDEWASASERNKSFCKSMLKG